jgi:replicative DNA helicase
MTGYSLDEKKSAPTPERVKELQAERAGLVQELAKLEVDHQIFLAKRKMTLNPGIRPKFLPESLHQAVRYPSRGQLWVLTAATGIGKTTFLLSQIESLVSQEIPVAMLGLEQEPDELRMKYACLQSGVSFAVAEENSWSEVSGGLYDFERVQSALVQQLSPENVKHLKFLPQRYIDLEVLEQAAKDAAQWGARVMVVDHIHHIQSGGSFNEYRKIVQACKRLAEEYKMVMLVAAQVGRKGSHGHALQRFMPPEIKDIEGGDVLAQNANVIVGIYRPLKPIVTDADKAKLKAAQARMIEPMEVLRPNTMGIVVMKHRARGEMEGRRVLLHLERGRLTDLPKETT